MVTATVDAAGTDILYCGFMHSTKDKGIPDSDSLPLRITGSGPDSNIAILLVDHPEVMLYNQNPSEPCNSQYTVTWNELDVEGPVYVRAYLLYNTGLVLSNQEDITGTEVPVLDDFTDADIIGRASAKGETAVASAEILSDGGDTNITYGHVWSDTPYSQYG